MYHAIVFSFYLFPDYPRILGSKLLYSSCIYPRLYEHTINFYQFNVIPELYSLCVFLFVFFFDIQSNFFIRIDNQNQFCSALFNAHLHCIYHLSIYYCYSSYSRSNSDLILALIININYSCFFFLSI